MARSRRGCSAAAEANSYDSPHPEKFSRTTATGRVPGAEAERMERVMGIEPTLEAWEAPVLPLNYTRFGRNSSTAADVENLDAALAFTGRPTPLYPTAVGIARCSARAA